MMDEDGEDELLLAATMRLGARGAAIGTSAVGAGLGGAKAGARGAARGFNRTKKDVRTTSVVLPLAVPAAADLVRHVLSTAGDLVGTEQREHGSVAIRAMLGVGFGGLNPAVVTAVITSDDAQAAVVTLRAVGREGLIKQHPAEKALAKVTALLSATRS